MGKYIVKRFLFGLVAFYLCICAIVGIMDIHKELTAREELMRIIFPAVSQSAALQNKTPEEVAQLRIEAEKEHRTRLGMTGPYILRNIRQTNKAIMLDLGQSSRGLLTMERPPSKDTKKIILEALPRTLYLFTLTTLVCILLSIWLGVKKVQYLNSAFDRITSVLTMFFTGIPTWLLGSYFVLFFCYYLRILPFGQLGSVPPPEGQLAYIFDRFLHLIIPVMSVALVRFWPNAFLIRNLLLDPLQQDYVMSARGRGITERRILFGHVVRSASPGIITLSLTTLVNSITGDIIIEKILAWPGIGSLFWNAVNNPGELPVQPDLPIVMGILTVLTAIVCLANFILDVLYVFLDPRIRYADR